MQALSVFGWVSVSARCEPIRLPAAPEFAPLFWRHRIEYPSPDVKVSFEAEADFRSRPGFLAEVVWWLNSRNCLGDPPTP